jgi:hypothetical protein
MGQEFSELFPAGAAGPLEIGFNPWLISVTRLFATGVLRMPDYP